MNKKFRLVLILLVAISIIAGGTTVRAGEFSVGAAVMYGWWKPFAANYLQQLDRKYPVKTTFFMENSSALYGPVLGYKISETWNLSFTLLTALHNQYSAGSYNATAALDGLHLARTEIDRVNKYDADLRAYYRASKYAGVFIAVNMEADKFFGDYRVLINLTPVLPVTIPLQGSLRSFQYDCGPGVGLNLTFELAKNLTAQIRLSLYVMGGTLQRYIQFEKRKVNTHMAFKSVEEVLLSYYIEGARTTISIGGRYHAMTFALMSASPREFFKNYTTKFDQLGGIIVTAAYTF
ncbi:MAG TPA: hypothetical protein PLM53_18210 [Spirochaetota bacterium]|nr:hypothetical protein [Spirochaetota bacterium]HPC42581.1 hypothetical protein [Spirochaetota bacterium]HPL18588.1 hypothetical protein [Spirochaetota bacterium]HQF08399.1 hypothetical protein [Spirochaetota bacterium]HQH99035.1 hypothetical protein [Spirochaetota bacterium]